MNLGYFMCVVVIGS